MCVCIPTHTHTFCCLVAKLCSTLCDSMVYSIPGSSALHGLPEFAQIHVHWVGDSSPLSWMSKHLIFCHPLLLLPSIFPSIRVFSNELALHIRWPKYWRFNFSISPCDEYSELISFRIDWLDLLAAQGTLKPLAWFLWNPLSAALPLYSFSSECQPSTSLPLSLPLSILSKTMAFIA